MDTQTSPGSPKLLTLVIGIVIGLLIAGGIFLVKSALESKDKESAKTTVETQGIILSVDQPTDGAITSDKNLAVSGSTGKDTTVVVTGGTKDEIVQTQGGKFTVKIELAEGESEIGVYAFDTDSGESAQTIIDALYLKDELALAPVLIAEASSTAETGQEKIEKLKEKISTTSSNLKKSSAVFKKTHVWGTVKTITDTSITIETNQGSLKTVFTDDFTKFFSIDTAGRSTIKLADLKVGDRVSVVGVSKDDSSGTAKFIVRKNNPSAKRHAILGKVKTVSTSSLTLTHLVQTDREFIVNVGNDTTVKIKGADDAAAAFKDIKAGDVVVAVGVPDKNGAIAATKIFVIPGGFKGVAPKEGTSSASPSATPSASQ